MKKNTHKLSPAVTGILLFLLSGLAMGITIMIQPGSLLKTIYWNLRSPILLILNFLPMVILIALLYFLIGNIFFSAGLTTIIWGALSFINLTKTQARGDPFVPGDVFLLLEGIEAAGSYELSFDYGKLILFLGSGILLFIAGFFFKSPHPNRKLRIGGILGSILIFVASMAGLYTNDPLYQGLPGPTRSNVPAVFDAFGFPYLFLHNVNLYPIDKPSEYSRAEAETFEKTYIEETSIPDTAPNILMVMCEAFTDLPNAEAFTYSPEDNPISFYNQLAAGDEALSGHIVVSNTGAGTANTEFDILTGMMTNRIGEGTSSAFRVIHRDTDSIPRMLADIGYKTFFMHPGDNWFYNRESVYSYLGITDQVFKDSFTDSDYKGDLVSDEAFLRKLTECLDERIAGDPLFTYSVSIQNHQAYTEGKYSYTPEAVSTDLPLSDEASTYLSVYFEGLRDSDAMLKGLTEYLNNQSEPYLLVFFGDHQPNLGGDYLSYRETGLYPEDMDDPEQFLSLYTAPVIIWGNEAWQANNNIMDIASDLGVTDDFTLSSHYLGALTCQIAGFRGLDGYMDYLNELRQKLPVYSVYGCMTEDGTWHTQAPSTLQSEEDLRWRWQYYRLKHQDKNTPIND